MSFPGGGGDNSVFVDIQGSSVSLVDATKMASDALLMTADSMGTLAGAADAMGGSVGASVGGFSEMGSAAVAAAGEMEDFAASTRMAAESAATMGGIMGGGGGGMLGGASEGIMASMGLTGMFGAFGDVISGAASQMMGFVKQAASMVAGLISFSVLNDVIQEVQGFTDSLITLNEQTEKNQYAWRYLYGGGNTAQGAGIAQQMADWTKKFSMQIPYTRQDLLNAITNLAPMGLSSQGLEHYMPMIADLAATRDPNANLAQVAQVIMSASMGYTRMLKYDLKINPEDLIQYGLNATGTGTGIHINDVSTLLPALQNYANAKHLTGAAQDIAHETFWGSWSSFIDRIQNFELDTGKGLFGSLKTALNDLSSWIDTHSDQISRFSDLIGNTLTNAFKGLTGIIGDFLTGVGNSGLFDFLHIALPDVPEPKKATTPQKGVPAKNSGTAHEGSNGKTAFGNTPPGELEPPKQLSAWQQAGQIIGGALKAIGEGWQTVSALFSPAVQFTIQQLGDAWTNFKNSFTPEEKETIKEIGQAILSIPWLLLLGVLQELIWTLQILSAILPTVIDVLSFLGAVKDRFGDFLGMLGQLKDKIGSFFFDLGEAPNGILRAVNNSMAYLGKMKDDIGKKFDELKTEARAWGTDFIYQLAAGMLTASGTVLTGALNSIGQTITDHLGHSAPTKGPLVGDDQWMPDMMHMFARGIQSGTSHITSAMDGVAQAMVNGLRPSGGYLPANGGGMPAGGTVIVINGSSTMEVMKVIDYAISKQGRNTNLQSRAGSGYGVYQFGTLGGH